MNDLHLIGSLPGWVIALAALAVAALLAQQWRSLRQRLAPGRTALIVGLRAVVYAVLLFFLFGPALIERRETRLRRPLTVLVDSSQSMNFPARAAANAGEQGAPTRLDLVREKLASGETPLIQRLSREYDLRLFRFGAGVEPMSPAAVAGLQAAAPGTRLLEIVESAAKEAGPKSGVIVFSDGIANGERQSLDGVSIPVPVFTVGVGAADGFVDLRVSDLKAPEFAFRGREFKVELTVKATGLKGKTVPLYFNRGRNLITSRSIVIDADPFESKVTLGFTPAEIGSHGFSVNVPLQPGEEIAQNNRKDFKIDVQRDKIRVLTLSGAPAWNYRFLRMALKQDPLVDLVSFVFLRTPTDTVDVPDTRLSLIPFPIDDIFLEELKNFDVVILDDFSHRSYFNPVYLERVRDFTRDGGGLAMFGGVRGFDGGGYFDTALKDVLPVQLDGKGGYRDGGNLRAGLTASGKAHPITRLVPDPRANEETWSKLPALTSYNAVRSARGETLVTAAGEGTGGPVPLLTVGRFNKGRTLAFMSDDAWRWNFIAVGRRETPQNHLKFVRQMVRWLAQEPSFEQVRIRPIPKSQPGAKTAIQVTVHKDDYTPAPQATVQLRVFGPEGEPTVIAASADGAGGEFTAEFTPVREGAYRVEAEASMAGKTLGRDRAGFSVAYPFTETDDGQPRDALLKQIAEVSKGEYFSFESWNEKSLERIAAALEKHAPSAIVEQRQTKLWSTLWPFALILMLLSIEWWMRRKWGMI